MNKVPMTDNGKNFNPRGGIVSDNCQLSQREKQCLNLLASGLRYQQIAFELGTSVRTVEKQISSARIKLNAQTIPHAVAIAIKNSLVQPTLSYSEITVIDRVASM